MTDAEIKAILEAAPDIGKVKHIDFDNWCRVMERTNRQTGEKVETLYMDVDGKLAMCIMDHALQEKTWDQYPPIIMEQSSKRLTLMVKVVSNIHGARFGIASSRSNGPAAEGSHPWESAETSALGRALVNMGYGLLPGAGRASGEDMANATPPTAKKAKPRAKKKAPTTPKPKPEGAPSPSKAVTEPSNGETPEIKTIGGVWTACHKILDLKPEAVRDLMGFLGLAEWLEEQGFTPQEGFEAIRDQAQAQVNGKDEEG